MSGHHSLIINILNDSFLEDLNSTNGTYVNGKLIKKHALAARRRRHRRSSPAALRRHAELGHRAGRIREDDGDHAGLGNRCRRGEESVRSCAARRRTESLRCDWRTAIRACRPSASATGEHPVALPKAKLQVLSGAFAGRELELNKALTTLGRPGVQVAAITRRADGFFIVHVDSGKPNDYPLVNGSGIGEQARKLQDNDVILLAGVKMGFFEG